MIDQHGLRNREDSKYIARHEALCKLDDIAREASKVLKTRGRMYMIHRPFRLAEIIITFAKYNLEVKKIRFVHSYVDKEPLMVMIEAVKYANSGVTIEKPLIIYKTKGEYTDEIKEIYR